MPKWVLIVWPKIPQNLFNLSGLVQTFGIFLKKGSSCVHSPWSSGCIKIQFRFHKESCSILLDLSARRRDINWHWEWSKITPLGRKKFMIVESPPCFTQKPPLTTCHWQVILSDARQTPLNTPYMFFSLERLVTKNQLLNTKYQTPNVSLIFLLSSQFEKRRGQTGLFSQKKRKQKTYVGIWFLVKDDPMKRTVIVSLGFRTILKGRQNKHETLT